MALNVQTDNRGTQVREAATAIRILELDGIRGLAILLVLLWHFIAVPMRPSATDLNVFWTLLGISWTGVDLFFVLSGFLIGGVLLDNRDSQNYFKAFYTRRICRILPIYYLVVFAYFAFVTAGLGQNENGLNSLLNNPMPFWSYATFLQNIVMTVKTTFGCGWLAMTWSLAIEEQFYLLLPFLIRFLPPKRLPWVLLGGILLAPCIRCALIYFERREALAAGYVMMPCRADALLLGVLVALAMRTPAVREWFVWHRAKIYGVFGILLLGVIAMAYGSPRFISVGVTCWGRSLVAAFYGVLLLIALLYQNDVPAMIMRSSLLRYLGIISYGVYLIHQTVLALTLAFLFPSISRTPAVLALPTLVAFVLVIVIAVALYQLIEKPIVRLGHRVRYN